MPVAPSKARAFGTLWAKSCSEGGSACPADGDVDVPALAARELTMKQLLTESGSALSHGLPFPPAHSKSENSQGATSLILGTRQFSIEKTSQKDQQLHLHYMSSYSMEPHSCACPLAAVAMQVFSV